MKTNVKIGKNVIENLTTGMYKDSLIIYREYIQNSCDSIINAKRMSGLDDDEYKIFINLDSKNKCIKIRDNGTGVPSKKIEKSLIDIADSEKMHGDSIGFRGIGRLGGLAYCDELVFRTSYYNENIETILRWDAKKCRELLSDNNIHISATELIKEITRIETIDCESIGGYFEVELNGVSNKRLLDENKVKNYLIWNAPVDYTNKFYFRSKIYDWVSENGFGVDSFRIFINSNEIHKEYSPFLYESGQKKKYDELFDIEFKTFKNRRGEILAWMWYGVSSFVKNIPQKNNPMKGLRLRSNNVQVGDNGTLNFLFKENRGNGYFVGEVHAIHKDLIPNARRDYFNETRTRSEFEEQLKIFFASRLHKLYHIANDVKNSHKKIQEYDQKKKELEEKKLISDEVRKLEHERLKELRAKSEKAKVKIKKIKNERVDNPVTQKVIDQIEKSYVNDLFGTYGDDDEEREFSNQKVNKNQDEEAREADKEREGKEYLTENLTRLSRKERKVVSRIYEVIHALLPEELSCELIERIQKELS